MSADLVERRVLGAVRFTDAVTGLPVEDALEVTAPAGVRWIRNRRAHWVVARAPGLEAHEPAFAAPPAAPAPGTVSVALSVRDPAGRYLPRRATVTLPRDPDPAHADGAPAAASLFRPVDVPLFPAPAAPLSRAWAVVRAGRGVAPGAVLPGALLRVVRAGDGARIGGGMADARGEALVAVQGIPSASFGDSGDGPVVATEVAARIEVVWDPAAATTLPDPDDLEARRAALTVSQTPVLLASGRVLGLTI